MCFSVSWIFRQPFIIIILSAIINSLIYTLMTKLQIVFHANFILVVYFDCIWVFLVNFHWFYSIICTFRQHFARHLEYFIILNNGKVSLCYCHIVSCSWANFQGLLVYNLILNSAFPVFFTFYHHYFPPSWIFQNVQWWHLVSSAGLFVVNVSAIRISNTRREWWTVAKVLFEICIRRLGLYFVLKFYQKTSLHGHFHVKLEKQKLGMSV